MQYFECMVPKTFYSCFLCLRSKKVISFQIFPTLVQEKCWPQKKLWYLAKNVFIIWYRIVWGIFVHNLVTIEQKKRYGKEEVEGGGSNESPSPPNLFNLQKAQPCRVKGQNMLLEEKWTLLRFSSFRFCSITKTKNSKISESFLLLQILIAAVIYSKFIFCF